MSEQITVETQGISDDWASANDDFEMKSRGLLQADQVLSAMLHLASLDTPDSKDPCAPHIMTGGKAGSFSFVGQGGTIFCPDTDQEITPRQALDLAFGKARVAPPPPMPPKARATAAAQAAVLRPNRKRKFGWRGGIMMFLSLCFLLAAVVMVFGVFSMKSRAVAPDDVLSAITITGGLGLIGALMLALALKLRRTRYVDGRGRRVAKDGSELPFVMMGQSLGSYDFDDGGDDGGFDGDID